MALRFMIEKSGGAIRDLFEMIRNASFDALPCRKTEDNHERSEACLFSAEEQI